jgi:hypothetical protein
MQNIYNEKYGSLRANLKYIIDDVEIKSREQLSFIMAQRGFRKKKDGSRLYPSTKQLNIAFDYITNAQQNKWQTIDKIVFRTEKYKSHSVKRLMRDNIIYKGKTYKKGQFLPKEYK